MDLSFGVAGPGRVGMSLAKAFAAAGLSCAGVYGGTHAKARAAELGGILMSLWGLLPRQMLFLSACRTGLLMRRQRAWQRLLHKPGLMFAASIFTMSAAAPGLMNLPRLKRWARKQAACTRFRVLLRR